MKNYFNNHGNYLYGLLFLCIIMLIAPELRSEYIIYKSINDTIVALSKKEHAKAFKILMKYQFPMSQMLFLEKTDENKEELNELLEDEQAFVEKKLDELTLNLKIAFMPTTLYELLFIKCSLDDATKCFTSYKNTTNLFNNKFGNNTTDKTVDEKRNFDFYQEINFPLGARYLQFEYDNGLEKYNLANKWDIGNFFKAAHAINNSTRGIHQLFNNRIISYLEKLNMLKLLEEQEYGSLEQKLFEQFESLPQEVEKLGATKFLLRTIELTKSFDDATYVCPETRALSWFYQLFTKKEKKDLAISMLSHCIKTEYLTHKAGNWLVYRGTDPFDVREKIIDKLPASYSICYGNSLFGGLLREHTFRMRGGACAFVYFMSLHFNLLQRINIKNYCKKQEEFSLFYIPPYTTLLDIAVIGEDFHARSKIYLNPKTSPFHFGGRLDKSYELDGHYLITNLFNKISEKVFLEKRDVYLKTHQITIKQPKYLSSIIQVINYDLKLADKALEFNDADLYDKSLKKIIDSLQKLKQKMVSLDNILTNRWEDYRIYEEKVGEEASKQEKAKLLKLTDLKDDLKEAYKTDCNKLFSINYRLSNDDSMAYIFLTNIVPIIELGDLNDSNQYNQTKRIEQITEIKEFVEKIIDKEVDDTFFKTHKHNEFQKFKNSLKNIVEQSSN